MSNPSNIYAEKVFAEHPIALWALDDKADYISLISEADRNIVDWSITGGTAETSTAIDEPFPGSHITKLIGDVTTNDFNTITCISDEIINFNLLSSDMATFSIGAYIYSISSYISSIEIGYQYYDNTTGSTIQKLKNYNTSIYDQWIFVSETFDIPFENAELKLVIKITYIDASDTSDDYHFLVHGLTLGQWSEEFNSFSLGTSKQLIPSDIALAESYGIPAVTYGLQESNGYYLVKDNSLMAKNSGIPMVYGANNITILSPNTLPSLIVPGHGFLNESGKFNEYTFEIWARINSDAYINRRIFGPISSTDGIYVNGPFITLKINEHFGSHYIGEWARPMLMHIRLSNNSASLLINGEEVIILDFITSDLTFPDKLNGSNKDQDWLGFYSYEDVSPVEIDCISLYGYSIPTIVAKRRFVYGQGVEVPENINASYSGTSTFIDYAFADYTNNYNYPDLGSWSQASIDNLRVVDNMLTSPDYALPDIVFNNKTLKEFYTACNSIQLEDQLLFNLKPNSSWSGTNGYLLFNSVNTLSSNTKSFYGIFKLLSLSSNKKILFRLEEQITGNTFSIELVNNNINYVLKYNGVEETIYYSTGITVGETFVVGLDIPTFVNHYGGNVVSFFGNLASTKLYVGGCKEFTNTFDGNIYNISFSTEKNFNKISAIFNEYGVPTDFENIFNEYGSQIDYDAGEYQGADASFWLYVIDGGSPSSFASVIAENHIASYSLVPKIYFDNFELDIDINGSWEDQIPMSYFAQYVVDPKGNQYYDLDFIQFNLNYPAPSNFIEEETTGNWTYGELQSEYQNPVQRTYSSLDNHLFTGYLDYDDLKNKAVKNYKYDTSNSLVKSYVTFQYLETGATAPDTFFTTTAKAPKNNIVDPASDWIKTKYEIVDNMIMYPPQGADFNDLALVVYLNFTLKGINRYKTKIKKLQLASQAFNDVTPNPIGTRFGVPIYPYRKVGLYYDYKNTNPYSIYKGSSPYLYLTRYSGIQLKGTYDPLINRGLLIPINSEKSSNYKVMAMQAAVRFDEDFFPYAPTQIFEIESKDNLIKFYMVANHPSGKRAKIYAVNAKTGRIENGIGFYLNGNIVKEPTITIREWSMLGISFSSLLDFNNYVGSIKINGPILTNLISHYKSTNLQEVQNITERPWFKVQYSGPLTLDWQYWDSAYLWQGVLVLSSTSYYGVKPSDIYKSYTGTNKIIVDDTRKFRLNNYQYSVYTDVLWQSQVQNAV